MVNARQPKPLQPQEFVSLRTLDRRLLTSFLLLCGSTLCVWLKVIYEAYSISTKALVMVTMEDAWSLDYLHHDVDLLVGYMAMIMLPAWAIFGSYVSFNRSFKRRVEAYLATNHHEDVDAAQELIDFDHTHREALDRTFWSKVARLLISRRVVHIYVATPILILTTTFFYFKNFEGDHSYTQCLAIGVGILIAYLVYTRILYVIYSFMRVRQQRDAIIDFAHSTHDDEDMAGAMSVASSVEGGELSQIKGGEVQ